MGKTITINGTDFTSYFTPVGYKVGYKKIRGKNSGQMLDGSYTDDVVATKAVITATCMPLTEAQVSTLLRLSFETYLNIKFYDPADGQYRTSTFMPSDPSTQYRGVGATGNTYWSGTVMTFTER